MQAALASGDLTLSLAIAKQQDERFLDMPHDRWAPWHPPCWSFVFQTQTPFLLLVEQKAPDQLLQAL